MSSFLASVLLAGVVAGSTAGGAVYVESLSTLVNEVVEVPAGAYYYYGLELPDDATVTVRLGVSGSNRSLDAALVDESGLRAIESGKPYDAVAGIAQRIDKAGQITAQVDTAGNYFLVLDNRRARSAPRSVAVMALATSSAPTEESAELKSIYEERYRWLTELFNFPGFDIGVTLCGEANAYSSPTIVMCYELYDALHNLAAGEAEVEPLGMDYFPCQQAGFR